MPLWPRVQQLGSGLGSASSAAVRVEHATTALFLVGARIEGDRREHCYCNLRSNTSDGVCIGVL